MVALASETLKKFVLILIGRLSMTNGDAGGSMLFSSTFMETNILDKNQFQGSKFIFQVQFKF